MIPTPTTFSHHRQASRCRRSWSRTDCPDHLSPRLCSERENRFLARCRKLDGEEVEAHIPDRGRLLNLLVPGARVWLFSAGEQRRTRWSLLIAEEPGTGVLVAINPAGANARARPLIEQGLLTRLGGGWQLQPEVTLGESRIDFLLTRGSERVALEIRAGALREGIAHFPDAPTTRGVRHLGELERYVRPGQRAAVLFVAQRGDAQAVGPDADTNPTFAAALRRVSTTVELLAVRFEIQPEGCLFRGEIPVVLT